MIRYFSKKKTNSFLICDTVSLNYSVPVSSNPAAISNPLLFGEGKQIENLKTFKTSFEKVESEPDFKTENSLVLFSKIVCVKSPDSENISNLFSVLSGYGANLFTFSRRDSNNNIVYEKNQVKLPDGTLKSFDAILTVAIKARNLESIHLDHSSATLLDKIYFIEDKTSKIEDLYNGYKNEIMKTDFTGDYLMGTLNSRTSDYVNLSVLS